MDGILHGDSCWHYTCDEGKATLYGLVAATLTLTLMVYSSQQLAIRPLLAHQATLHDPFEPAAQNQALYSELPVRLHRALGVNMFGLKLGTLTIDNPN